MAARDAGSQSLRESVWLWFVSGASYIGPVRAVPQRKPGAFWLPTEKRQAQLNVDLFEHQSDARRRATMNARAGSPA